MSSQIASPNTEAAILARVIAATNAASLRMPPGTLLSMKLPAGDEDRVNDLSAKAWAGSLTDAEAQELDSYLHIGFLLGVMQSRARHLLKTEN